MIMNCPPKLKNSPNFPKEERNSIQIPIKNEKEKHSCPACHQQSFLVCYACCYEFACQACYNSQHYVQCKKKFNQYPINFAEVASEEEHKTKRHIKKSKHQQRCQRCLESCQKCQYCTRCKINLCLKCADATHSTGKFALHIRKKLLSSPLKYKKMQTFLTETDEAQENVMKKSTKDNLEIGKEKMNKMNSTPVQNKKGRSVAKNSLKNQENMIVSTVGRDKNVQLISQQPEIIDIYHQHADKKITQTSWELCQIHHKMRTILTDSCELICLKCYEEVKESVSKVKSIDIANWLKEEVNIEEVKLNFSTSLSEFSLKLKQLQADFARYRQSLSEEFTKKEEMLAEKYKTNLTNLQKWEAMYKDNINNVIKVCQDNLNPREQIIDSEVTPTATSKQKLKNELNKILSFKSRLALQEIAQYKKEYYIQQEQYQFRVNEINPEYFEDMIKNFYFARRKIDNDNQMSSHQKSLSRFQQSNNLRQSRLSNSSLITDRKTLKRDDSFQKSNYCELSNSNNLIKRSISKEIRQDLTKDISQKILFNVSGINSEKKGSVSHNVKKFEKQMKNSQYFFESMQDSSEKLKAKSKKEPIEMNSYSFKDVKYVNLQNFLTEKLDKIYDQKKEIFSSIKGDDKATLFANDLEISTELVDLQEQSKTIVSDSRMSCSITNPATFNKNPPETISNSNSIHTSVHATNKNKRKSDYMQMRDRLRKPNIIHKLNK